MSKFLPEDTKLQRELITEGADYIAQLASVVMPTNIECARCVVHAIEDLGYEFVKKQEIHPLSEAADKIRDNLDI